MTLIFDEVKTGFRIAPGGAAEYFGVIPDMSTFPKALGNGYLVAAIGGKRDIMVSIEPDKAAHGGTYTGNVVGTAATDATLEYINTGSVFKDINRVGGTMMVGIAEILNRLGIAHQVHGTPEMFGITFGEKKPKDFHELNDFCDWDMYESVGKQLVENGIFIEPDGYEPWFLCSDHTDQDASETLQKFEDAVKDTLAIDK